MLSSFIVCCDACGMPCTLVRGDYGYAWNEVNLPGDKEGVVDLMVHVGALYDPDSEAAFNYCSMSVK